MKALELPNAVHVGRLYHGFFDDFNEYVSADRWTLVASDSGTATLGDTVGGVITLAPSDGTVADNDEAYLKTTKEIFKIAADAPIIVEVLLNFTEANTDDANVLFGLMDAVAANSLLDDAGGPEADYSGAVFFKVDGGTTWSAENSNSTTQKTTNLDGTQYVGGKQGDAQTAGGAWEKLTIEIRPKSSTLADFIFTKDDEVVAKHVDQSYSSATEMNVVLAGKNGSANAESITADYIFAYQRRTNA